MKIGLSYDLKEAVARSLSGQPEDALEEYDSLETVEALRAAIEAKGHHVVKLGGGREFLTRILAEKVDFVFNISEGLGSYRSREAQIPSVLEMLDIPYSGSDPQCLAICLDKHLTKKIVNWAGIPTPRWQIITSANVDSIDWQSLALPAFVKPVWEGSSKGIRLKSRANYPDEVKALVQETLAKYNQPVLVEEFIAGEEVTVGLVGNAPPSVMGIMRIIPRKKDTDFIYSLEVKRDYENLVEYECPARLGEYALKLIREYSLRAFDVLECRDFARIDFRISQAGEPFFLEINPLAGLNPRSSDLIIMARLQGIQYNDLIGVILDSALKRYPRCR
ncbi:MAG: D-alanine--D-alanine ligase [Dehalococcoidales bacterium]|jgi:D-alanine-D-alanine ligase|nr:D-alanine--D-alanine ligase [Dehalococcoidales bacterium]